MTRRADVFFLAMATAAALMCPAVASAATQCQASPTTVGAVGTQGLAIAAWSAQVKKTYGVEWSNLNLAKNPQYSETNLALATMYFVTASPCRTIIPINTAIIVKPKLAIQRH